MIAPLLLVAALGAGPSEDKEEAISVVGRTQLTCPACRRQFTTVVCAQSNTRGGVDRDLFARAVGPQPEFYRVATCPNCGYSGYLTDFGRDSTLPPEVLDRVLQSPKLALPPGFGPESDPRDLDPSVRYALAVICYQWRHRSDEALGWLYLRSSWVEREEGSSVTHDDRLKRTLTYLERWRPALIAGQNQLDIEMQLATRTAEGLITGRFNRFQRPFVELALALILRRHGENTHADPLLDRLEKSPEQTLSSALRQDISNMRQSIIRERRHQQQAADAFERALMANLISADNRGPAAYVLGELYRRLGRESEAIRWYDRALAEPNLAPDLRRWAAEQRGASLPLSPR
jgi:hypothetical protein